MVGNASATGGGTNLTASGSRSFARSEDQGRGDIVDGLRTGAQTPSALDVDSHGTFGCRYLDHFWTESDRHRFLIEIGAHLAGVAVVRSETRAADHMAAGGSMEASAPEPARVRTSTAWSRTPTQRYPARRPHERRGERRHRARARP